MISIYAIYAGLMLLIATTSIGMMPPPFLSVTTQKAAEILQKLSIDEKIGQLFTIAAVSDEALNKQFIRQTPYPVMLTQVKDLIKKYRVGGIIFLGTGTPEKQRQIMEEFERLSPTTPLLFAQDGEWGLSMRLQNVPIFPRNITLGAIAREDEQLLYEFGTEIGRQCKIMGIHLNLAPVVDVNNNPYHPIINARSFGKSPEEVARKVSLVFQGMQDAGILTCGKHLPGHGDTDKDSHDELPIINHSRDRLNTVELLPFQKIINNGISAIMTAHLIVPALEPNKNIPASLSHNVVTKLLKQEMHFNGLIITDGLGMQGAINACKPGDLELNALKAGNDILLCPIDIQEAFNTIKYAVTNGTLSEAELDEHVLKILRAKIWAQERTQPQSSQAVCQHLNTSYALELKKKLYRAAITLAKNNNNLVPLKNTQKPIPLITIGDKSSNQFQKTLSQTLPIQHYHLSSDSTEDTCNAILNNIASAPIAIIDLHALNRIGIIEMIRPTLVMTLMNALQKQNTQSIATVFGSPYGLKNIEQATAIIAAYEHDDDAQEAAADVITGLLQPKGKLPVTASKNLPAGSNNIMYD